MSSSFRVARPPAVLSLLQSGAVLALFLSFERSAWPAPVDGVDRASCPDPEGEVARGISAAYLCDVQDRSPLDQPIDTFESPLHHVQAGNDVRAGAYSPAFHSSYLTRARSVIGDERFLELAHLPRVAARSDLRALERCAAIESEPTASQCQAVADTLLLGAVDAAIPELVATRPDPDRSVLLDPNQPIPELADLVSHLAPGVALNLERLDASTVPGGIADDSYVTAVVPLFVGPDGLYNTADDLPETREHLHPDLQLETNIPAQLTTYVRVRRTA